MKDDKMLVCPYCGLRMSICNVTGRRDGYIHSGGYKGAFTCYRCTNVFKFDIVVKMQIDTKRVPHQLIGVDNIGGLHKTERGYGSEA